MIKFNFYYKIFSKALPAVFTNSLDDLALHDVDWARVETESTDVGALEVFRTSSGVRESLLESFPPLP